MKRRNFILMGITAATAVTLHGCFRSGPAAAIERFMRAMDKGNIEEAMEFYPQSFYQTFGKDKARMFLVEMSKELQAKGGIKSFKVNNEEVTGDLATVNFTVTYEDGSQETEEMSLLKQDGKWLANPDSGK